MFYVSIDFADVETVLKNHGLQDGGPVQQFFTSELMRLSDPYVPFRSSVLKNSAHLNSFSLFHFFYNLL